MYFKLAGNEDTSSLSKGPVTLVESFERYIATTSLYSPPFSLEIKSCLEPVPYSCRSGSAKVESILNCDKWHLQLQERAERLPLLTCVSDLADQEGRSIRHAGINLRSM